MTNKSNKTLAAAGISAMVLIHVGIWIASENASERGRQEYERELERQRAIELACPSNPACLDEKATLASIGRSAPVMSMTGRWFYKGRSCLSDCSGHIAGYDWAKREDLFEYDECSTGNPSFDEGCELFVFEARVDEDLE